MDMNLQKELQQIARGVVRFNEPMKDHTSIKIGGPADIWFEPADADDLLNVTKWADERDLRKMIFGNGSNVLVRDNGIRGLVISLKNFSQISRDGDDVRVGAGLPLAQLIHWSVENSLSGLETLTSIPGTVGGALAMNAGIKEGYIGERVKEIKWIAKGRVTTAPKDSLQFEYRRLKMMKNTVILEALLELKAADRPEIEAKIERIKAKRKEVQPLLWPSMGSIFKNPEKAPSAWQLIDDCNLRNVRVGGARISNEHTNWIINEGNATAKDVEVLIKMIREHVRERSDVNLETEILIVGEQ